MNLKNQRPIFVPQEYWAEIEKMSKAALMDMVWDYATSFSHSEPDNEKILREFRSRRDVILHHRRCSTK